MIKLLARLFAAGGFLLFAPMALAQSSQFPVAELGNCASQEECAVYCDVPENGPQCLEYGKKTGRISPEEARALEILPEQKGPGGCTTDVLCRAYCDDAAHTEECIAFAEQHGIGDQEEFQRAREFLEKPGPGGCKGEECRTYCEDPSHQEECISFAEANGFMSKEEAAKARKLAGKSGPGGCKGEECRTYCEDPNHIDECLKFSEENGFISKDEAARMRKLGLATGPGGCKGQECKVYCDDQSHANECIDFAVANGFMKPEEAERAKKFANTAGPGGCKGEECRTYCEDPAHQEECLKHAEENGLIPKEELERAKKFLKISQEGGPGGCKGKDACETFCRDPQNQETCFEFAKKQGFIKPEDEKNFEIGKKLHEKLREAGGPGGCKNENECRTYCQDPARTEECIAFASAHGGVSKEDATRMLKDFSERRFEARGEFQPPEDFRKFEEEAQKRFEEFRTLEQEFRGRGDFSFPGGPQGFQPSGGPSGLNGEGGPQQGRAFVGPGGCASPNECIKYCSEHQQECFQAGPPSGQPGSGNQGGFGPRGFGGAPSGEFAPRLQRGLLKEFSPSDIPQNFGNEEERQDFFKKKFDEFQGGQGVFPGRPPQQFPGQGSNSEFPGRVEGGFPPGGDEFMKKEFENRREFNETQAQDQREMMKKQFENQQELQKRMNEFRGQAPQGFKPPEGQDQPRTFEGLGPQNGSPGIFGPLNTDSRPPESGPSGDFNRPPEGFKPPEGSFTPPPTGSFQPPSVGTFQPLETQSAPPPLPPQ